MKRAFIFFFISLLFLTLALIITTPRYPRPDQKKSSVITITDSREWANCNNIRQSIEYDSKRYLACYGGVLVLDSNNQVVDQITMADGLGNPIVNSLVIKNNRLFMGTQDGVTVFDLSSRKAQKISVSEGLVNGSNIFLKEDGESLWVGTFNGVSKINSKDLSIKNYTTELGISPVHNIRDILVTPVSVYFTYVGGGGSAGGVARYDKLQDQWESFSPSDFIYQDTSEDRLDFSSLTQKDGQILLGNPSEVWQTTNSPHSTWTKVSNPEGIFSYDIDPSPELTGRPNTFDKLLAIIDSHLFFSSGSQIWQLDLNTFSFQDILTLSLSPHSNNISFVPVTGSTKVLIFGQSCGMFCSEPEFVLYDYLAKTTETIGWPQELKTDPTMPDYEYLDPQFTVASQGVPLPFLSNNQGTFFLDLQDLSWSNSSDLKPTHIPPNDNPCLPNYLFSDMDGFVAISHCTLSTINHPSLPVAPPKYSPFPDWPATVYAQPAVFSQDLVWTGTNRGLIVYSPQTQKTQLISTTDGLTSNEITKYVVLDKLLIVATDAGLSVLKYK